MPCLVAWSLALVLLRTLKPRQSFRRIARQPSGAFCIVIVMFMLSILVNCSVRLAAPPWSALAPDPSNSLYGFVGTAAMVFIEVIQESSGLIAFGILVAWGLLRFGRRSRFCSDWIDVAAIVASILWLTTSVILWAYFVEAVSAR